MGLERRVAGSLVAGEKGAAGAGKWEKGALGHMVQISLERPIAVIGRSGQLAEALIRLSGEAGLPIVAGGRPEVDIADIESLKRFVLATRPSVVINAAAYTAVDQAESEQEAALRVNGEGPARLGALCAIAGLPLIHVSTDFVFSGLTETPYPPETEPSPLGVYGASKAAGEVGVRVALPSHVIVRTSWVYGVAGRNFVKTMLRLGRERGEVAVVDDQIGAPTFADDLAAALVAIARNITSPSARPEMFGTFHFSNGGQTTWCRFAQAIFEEAGEPGRPLATARPISTAEYPTPARRPPYSVLDTRSLEAVHGVAIRDWRMALAEAMPHILAAERG